MIEDNDDVINSQDSIKEDKRWCVYCHTNKENGKKYIGITCQRPEVRWKAGSPYKKNSHFWRAIQKYGWYDGFDHEIIALGLTEEEACELEINFINMYDTTNPDKGYNQTTGGETSFKLSDESRQKMRDNHYDCSKDNNPFYGKHHSKETRDKISNARKGRFCGENSPLYGTHPSEETKKKMSESAKTRPTISDKTREKMSKQRSGFKNSAAKRPVYCIELNEIFWGAMAAKEKYGINDNALRNSIRTKKYCAGKHPDTNEGLHWLYAHEAIEQYYITQDQLDEYLNNLNTKEND